MYVSVNKHINTETGKAKHHLVWLVDGWGNILCVHCHSALRFCLLSLSLHVAIGSLAMSPVVNLYKGRLCICSSELTKAMHMQQCRCNNADATVYYWSEMIGVRQYDVSCIHCIIAKYLPPTPKQGAIGCLAFCRRYCSFVGWVWHFHVFMFRPAKPVHIRL